MITCIQDGDGNFIWHVFNDELIKLILKIIVDELRLFSLDEGIN